MVVIAGPLAGPSDRQLQALTRALRTPRGERYGHGDERQHHVATPTLDAAIMSEVVTSHDAGSYCTYQHHEILHGLRARLLWNGLEQE